MTEGNTNEANSALLTAGIGLALLGGWMTTFPSGPLLGIAVSGVGLAVAVVFGVRVWRQWRRRPKRPRSAEPDPDRFWNAEKRLTSATSILAVFVVSAVVRAILEPAEDHLQILWLLGPLLLGAVVALVLVTRRNRRKEALRHPPDGRSFAPD